MPDHAQHQRHWLWPLLLATSLSYAEPPAPPADFWDYYGEFEDADGEIFDPQDLGDAEAAAQQARVRQPLFGRQREQNGATHTGTTTESEESTP